VNIETFEMGAMLTFDLTPSTQPLLSSVPCVSLISYTEQYVDYDPFVSTLDPSNPWTSDDPSIWDLEARYETINQSSLTSIASEDALM